MKASIRIIAVGLVASLAVVSCAKQEAKDNADSVGGVRTIAVSFANGSTKSALEGLQPKFVANDVIKVSNGTDAPVDCTVEIDGSGDASITTSLTGSLTMVYPATAAKMNGNAIDGVLVPTVQDGTFASANICKADIVAGATSATFANQTAVFRFYVDASIGVKSIAISSTAANIADGSKTVTVDPEGDVTLDTVTDDPDKRICYVAVLPVVESTNLTFTSVTTTQTKYPDNTVSRTVSSTTLANNTIYNAFIPYYIDLGTVGKWAYCNVGAFLPEEYGDYFMWGAVEKIYSSVDVTKTSGAYTFVSTNPYGDKYKNTWDASKGFNWNNCLYTEGVYANSNINVFTKYTGSINAYAKGGTADGKTVLELEDDAANVNWGGSWRLPTKAEFEALNAITDRGWDGDRKGYMFGASPAQIFLPASGLGYDSGLFNAGDNGYYWSSSLDIATPHDAYSLSFITGEAGTDDYHRYDGQSVRPVSD